MDFGGYNPNNFVGGFGNMPQQPQAMQTVMQNCYMPIEVRDEAEARSYPVAANTTVMLMCRAEKKFWIKSTNASGTVVAFRPHRYEEEIQEQPQYITKADLDSKFDEFEKRLLETLGGNKQ